MFASGFGLQERRSGKLTSAPGTCQVVKSMLDSCWRSNIGSEDCCHLQGYDWVLVLKYNSTTDPFRLRI